MPKTKDAFAFRDFDRERILQRPFFRQWREVYHVGDDLSDKEILATVTMAGFDVSNFQEKSTVIEDLIHALTSYEKMIERHWERLKKHSRIVVETLIMADIYLSSDVLRERTQRARELAILYHGFYSNDTGEIVFAKSPISFIDARGTQIHMRSSNSFYDCVERLRSTLIAAWKTMDDDFKRIQRKVFGDRLKYARQSAKLTQTQLGKILHLAQRTISDYEIGISEPGLSTLLLLSKILGQSTDWLLGAEPW